MPLLRTRRFAFGPRNLLELGAAAALTLAAVASIVLTGTGPVHAENGTYPISALMAPQPLPDIVQGKADAPVTIIEYASMTCPHCAAFHAETYPKLVSKYVDTGKVRFILREFPLDAVATAGFMVARCAGPDKRNAMIDLLFDQQKTWALSDKPLDALSDLVKQTGMSQDTFNACMNNQQLYDNVVKEGQIAATKFGVDATPTFFINGKKQSGELTIDAFDKLLAPMLTGKTPEPASKG